MKFLHNILPFAIGFSTALFPIGLALKNDQQIKLQPSQVLAAKSSASLTITKMISQPLQEEVQYELTDLDPSANYFITVYDGPNPIIFHESATGSFIIHNLDPTVIYRGYTVNLIEEVLGSMPIFRDIVDIPNFQVLEEQHIDNLIINQEEAKSDGIHILYTFDTNIDSKKLVVQVLDKDKKVVISGIEDKLKGEIIIPLNPKENATNQQFTLKVLDKDYPNINQKTEISLLDTNDSSALWLISIIIVGFYY